MPDYLTARAEYAEAALSDSRALLAMAFEVAAEAAYQWWDDEDAQELRETVRALTPADAQAALDARINAAKEEGRVMGLREAARMCETDDDIWTWDECRDAILAAAEKEAGNG